MPLRRDFVRLRHKYPVVGIDTKFDFTALGWPFLSIMATDDALQHRPLAVALMSDEASDTVHTVLTVLLANLPCDDATCTHKAQRYLFRDRMGWFQVLPCALQGPAMTDIVAMMDKSKAFHGAIERVH